MTLTADWVGTQFVIAIVHQGEQEEFDETVRMSFTPLLLISSFRHRRAAHGDSRPGNRARGNGLRCRHDARPHSTVI
jgi:hypothetical protein